MRIRLHVKDVKREFTLTVSLLLATSSTGPIREDESAQKAFKRLKELFASALILT